MILTRVLCEVTAILYNGMGHYFLDRQCNNKYHLDGLVQDCCNSIANVVELLQSCPKSLIYGSECLQIQYIDCLHKCVSMTRYIHILGPSIRYIFTHIHTHHTACNQQIQYLRKPDTKLRIVSVLPSLMKLYRNANEINIVCGIFTCSNIKKRR